MESAKVTFSNEFEEKTKYKKLSRKQKNHLRMMKFESLTPAKLGQCHTIIDIVRALGMEDAKNSQAGRKFVNKLLEDKKILSYETGELKGPYRLHDYCFPASDPRSKDNLIALPISSKKEKQNSWVFAAKNLDALSEETLKSVHTRAELAKLLGYKKRSERKKGRTAVANLIYSGKLIEERTNKKKGNAFLSNYSLPSTKKVTPATVAEKVTENIVKAAEKITTKITISCNSVNITLEDPTPELVNTVLEKIPLS